MAKVIGHNIISPLGNTSEENFEAVRQGKSNLQLWHDRWNLPFDFEASLFSNSQIESMAVDNLSTIESLVYSSVNKAVKGLSVDLASPRTILIISTTKGEISDDFAKKLGFTAMPIIVDNACISGLSALLLASRLIDEGLFDTAVVCGVELQSRFIVSGFQSLKSMSLMPCRPFDIERNGLNLGEAAATIVLSNESTNKGCWHITRGAVRNDAFHIATPSRTAEGEWRALQAVKGDLQPEDISFVNCHGTATLFNDQMEAVAIDRAGLQKVPVNSLKGNYGHTMGACGVLETILSMLAADDGIALPTKNFKELGVSKNIHIVEEKEHVEGNRFIKMLSGFGGCNGALLFENDGNNVVAKPKKVSSTAVHKVHITQNNITVDGERLPTESNGKAMLTELYKQYVGTYPRFYKMDMLCRLGFIATELLIKAEEDGTKLRDRDDVAVILAGHSGSIVADNAFRQTITADNFYPSPEKFVYTLPNIVTGEIAVRNGWHGETEFYLLPKNDDAMITNIINAAFSDKDTKLMVCGWINCDSVDDFEVDMELRTKVE